MSALEILCKIATIDRQINAIQSRSALSNAARGMLTVLRQRRASASVAYCEQIQYMEGHSA